MDRVSEDVADGLPARRPPVQFAPIGPAAPTQRHPDAAGDQVTEDAVHRPLPIELIEDQADDPPDLLVRVQRDLPGRRLDVPDRDGDHQLPATSLVQFPLVHPLLWAGGTQIESLSSMRCLRGPEGSCRSTRPTPRGRLRRW